MFVFVSDQLLGPRVVNPKAGDTCPPLSPPTLSSLPPCLPAGSLSTRVPSCVSQSTCWFLTIGFGSGPSHALCRFLAQAEQSTELRAGEARSLSLSVSQAPSTLCALLYLCVYCVLVGTRPQHTYGGQRTTSGASSHLPPCLGQTVPFTTP